jgi:hypothetical protein
LLCVTAISVGRKVLTELLLRTEGLELLLAAREAGTLSVRMIYRYTLRYIKMLKKSAKWMVKYKT